MEFSQYVKGVSFRFFQPDADVGSMNQTGTELLVSPSVEVDNTLLPEDQELMRERLVELLTLPRMSTFAVAAMINKAVSELPTNCCFLNIGVWHGFTLLAGMRGNRDKRCIGVDNFSEFDGPRVEFLSRFDGDRSENHYFYEQDYEEYLRCVHRTPIGIYFYDAGHSFEDQLKGLQLAEPHFTDSCIVIVDDTNWEAPRKATVEFLSQSANRYEVLLDARTRHNKHPTLWNGLLIIRRTTGS